MFTQAARTTASRASLAGSTVCRSAVSASTHTTHTAIRSTSASSSIGLLNRRSFYTFGVPKDTKRIVLDDGSKLVFRKAQQVTGAAAAAAAAAAAPSSARSPSSAQERTAVDALLPPRVRTFPQRTRLTDEQIQRMRSLRESDPDSWTVGRLAAEFNTFPGFVMRVTRCPAERVRMLQAKAQAEFDDSFMSTKMRIVNRLRRKALW